MADEGPPHLVAGEFETLRALYDFQRDSFVRKVSGVSDEAAARNWTSSSSALVAYAESISPSAPRSVASAAFSLA